MSNPDDPLDIEAREKAKAESKDRKSLASLQETEDLKWLLSDKRGRRVLWRILERTGLYRTSFTGNSETYFREGQRDIGLQLLSLITANCPEKYGLMMTENSE
jgi:hypothetical protein